MNNQNTSSNRRPYFLFIIAQLYIIQGIPVGLAFDAYPILLRDAGVSLAVIAIIPLAGIPWVVKFLWAPFVENYWLDKIGYRKTWLLPMQFLLAILITVVSIYTFINKANKQLLITPYFKVLCYFLKLLVHLSMTLAEYFNYLVAFFSALMAIIAIFVINKKYLKLFT